MNKERRNNIQRLNEQLEKLKGQVEDLMCEFESVLEDAEAIRDEEQEYFDNMPESLQGGEKGDTAQNNIDVLDDYVYTIEAAKDELDSIITFLDDAVNHEAGTL